MTNLGTCGPEILHFSKKGPVGTTMRSQAVVMVVEACWFWTCRGGEGGCVDIDTPETMGYVLQ